MKLTVESVQELLPGFDVAEQYNGIRVRRSEKFESEFGENPENEVSGVTLLIKAAIALNLTESQFQSNCLYQEAAWGSSWTGKYSDNAIKYDVLFLFE